MKDFTKAIITGAILGASLGLIANYAHASTASANHGHHGGPNSGALGCNCAAKAAASTSATATGSGQSGQGGSYGDWYLKQSAVDAYQPWPEAEMRQYQKP